LGRKAKSARGLSVLVVDDEPGIRRLCREYLGALGCEVADAADVRSGETALERGGFDLVLLDVRLPDGSGLDLFRSARERWPELSIAIITGHASVEDAIDAVKLGAVDYITKPFDLDRLKEVAEAAASRLPVSGERRRGGVFEFHGILAASPEMVSVCQLIQRAAQSSATVLIQGETGTGKELVANAIHQAGPNARQPFVPVECSAIPAGLLESELFGHVKGAFTGAHADSPGLFLSAGRGTLFLDEIGELPPALQAKLLRALQEHEVRPVGATRTAAFRARVIVATNRNLRSAMADGRFRRDLFYRLHVMPVYLPPLRERKQDIGPLAQRFLDGLNAAAGRRAAFAREALEAFEKRQWPGNVRELQNAVERAFALTTGDLLDAEQVSGSGRPPEAPREGDRLEDYERQAVQAALEKAGGNREQAAKILGIGVATLFRKLKKYDLK